MKTNRIMATLLSMLIFLPYISAAPTGGVKKKQSDLEKLRKDIDRYEQRIKEKERKEHATLELLDTYDRQAVLLRQLIRKLHDEEQTLRRDINDAKQSIAGLNERVAFLKNQYAQYVTTAYKFGRTYDVELLLTSASFNQMLVRSEYLKRFSEQRKKDLDRIADQRSTLEVQSVRLQRQLSRQRQIIDEKADEESRLAMRTRKRKLLLAEIRKDKTNYQREVDRKTEAARELEQLIARSIERDRIKREQQPKETRIKQPENTTLSKSGFEVRRGNLQWPVSQGKIASRFGVQQNPVLHTITQNTGIDIVVPSGTSVGAVADGEVSTIWWLPSFGNLIILNHKNGFRTVYAHLSEISVSEGDEVKAGEQIGKSGEALSGPLLHFELWKDREKQDPEQWLRPQGLTKR